MPQNDPLCPAPLAAWLRGWWAAALADRWPATPRGLCPLLESRWQRGAIAGSLSRIVARRQRAA